MLSFVSKVQNGLVNPINLIKAESTKQAYTLELSKHCDVEAIHNSGVNSIDIEGIDSRYMISGGANGSIYIHDIENHNGKPSYTCKAIAKIKRRSSYAHQYSVERVQWYPLDTGLFTSSGMDCRLKLWDSNVLRPVETIQLQGGIYCHHLSPIGQRHSLIAVALAHPHVSLVDMRTGSKSHQLHGHKGKVLSVTWSPCAEHLLASGGSDNKIHLWDVRSAKGFLCCLDRHNGATDAKMNKQSATTAHGGAVSSLEFSKDGLHLVSFGTDERVRLWDIASHSNTLVNYGKVENGSSKGLQMTICSNANPPLIVVPSEGHILVFDMFTGEKVDTLLGHFNTVNCIQFRPFYQELYSGGNDRNILIWLPYDQQIEAYEEFLKEGVVKEKGNLSIVKRQVTEDAWSSDEN